MSDDKYVRDFEEYIQRRTEGGKRDLVIKAFNGWVTPASKYPNAQVGKARIKRMYYDAGVYMMYGVDNFDLFEMKKRVRITCLEIDKQVWMVDDPPHYLQICETAAKLEGNILVGGLGLGLIAHELAANDRVTDITVVERDEDVIALISPLISERVKIIHGDFYEHVAWRKGETLPYDAAFVDLWVTHGTEDTRRCYIQEVMPLAWNLWTNHHMLMYALGFTGSDPIVEPHRTEDRLESIRYATGK